MCPPIYARGRCLFPISGLAVVFSPQWVLWISCGIFPKTSFPPCLGCAVWFGHYPHIWMSTAVGFLYLDGHRTAVPKKESALSTKQARFPQKTASYPQWRQATACFRETVTFGGVQAHKQKGLDEKSSSPFVCGP